MDDQPNLDSIRTEALNRIDRAQQHYRLAFFAGAVLELAFLMAYLLLADLSNRMHVLVLLAAVAVYSVVVLGLVALGAHVSRSTARILKAIALVDRHG